MKITVYLLNVSVFEQNTQIVVKAPSIAVSVSRPYCLDVGVSHNVSRRAIAVNENAKNMPTRRWQTVAALWQIVNFLQHNAAH